MISTKVMKLDEYEAAIFYRVACDCISPECDLTLEMEYDKDLNMIFLNMYKRFYWTSGWISVDELGWWWKDKWIRLKAALKLLFTGGIDIEECLVLKGEGHIETFIAALQEGKMKLGEGIKNETKRQ